MTALLNNWFIQQILLPTLDVLLLSFLLYRGYQILVQTRAVQLLRGALFLGVLYAVSFFLNLRTVLWLINLLAPSLVIGIAIIFQPELRKIFTRIGQGRWLKSSGSAAPHMLDAVVSACEVLAFRRRGALIVFSRSVGLREIIETGTSLDAEISSALVLTVFSFDTALHDGAMVIEGNRVAAAGCFLPLSEQTDVRRSFGTRHRAALGLAEESDAVVLVVSEETGALSLAHDANLHYDLTATEIQEHLTELLDTSTRGVRRGTVIPREEVAEIED